MGPAASRPRPRADLERAVRADLAPWGIEFLYAVLTPTQDFFETVDRPASGALATCACCTLGPAAAEGPLAAAAAKGLRLAVHFLSTPTPTSPLDPPHEVLEVLLDHLVKLGYLHVGSEAYLNVTARLAANPMAEEDDVYTTRLLLHSLAPRYPHFPPLVALLEAPGGLYLAFELPEHSLDTMLRWSRDPPPDDSERRFLVFQLVKALHFVHSLGLAHGGVRPLHVALAPVSWVTLSPLHLPSRDPTAGASPRPLPETGPTTATALGSVVSETPSYTTDVTHSDTLTTAQGLHDALEEDHHAFLLRAQRQAPAPKPTARKVGHSPGATDLQFVSFRPDNTFQKGETVVVPRSRGGFTYARVLSVGPQPDRPAPAERRPSDNSLSASRHSSLAAANLVYGLLISPEKSLVRSWKESPASAIGKIQPPSPGSEEALPSPLREALMRSAPSRLDSIVLAWVAGRISNFGYVMHLNALAGRRLGDPQHHPVLPWVLDFTTCPLALQPPSPGPISRPPKGWRDLSRTKYRLAKGDEMLDFTFNGPVPHHITECLSEITYCIYLARRLPVNTLTKFVRSHFQPREYPVSMERVYSWTPDECIPEFYTDPSVFKSIHGDMEDLGLPSWAASPEDFVQKHRLALESDYVSAHLHHWLDLVFGYKLTGPAAVRAKNVVLPVAARPGSSGGPTPAPPTRGFMQLFTRPHPMRFSAHSPQLAERLLQRGDDGRPGEVGLGGDAVFVDALGRSTEDVTDVEAEFEAESVSGDTSSSGRIFRDFLTKIRSGAAPAARDRREPPRAARATGLLVVPTGLVVPGPATVVTTTALSSPPPSSLVVTSPAIPLAVPLPEPSILAVDLVDSAAAGLGADKAGDPLSNRSFGSSSQAEAVETKSNSSTGTRSRVVSAAEVFGGFQLSLLAAEGEEGPGGAGPAAESAAAAFAAFGDGGAEPAVAALGRPMAAEDGPIPLPPSLSGAQAVREIQLYEHLHAFDAHHRHISSPYAYHVRELAAAVTPGGGLDAQQRDHAVEAGNLPASALLDAVADDLFGLGCLLVELYTGQPPFTQQQLADYVAGTKAPQGPPVGQLPQPEQALAAALCSLQPTQRPSTALLLQLENIPPPDEAAAPNGAGLTYGSIFAHYFEDAYRFLSGFYARPAWPARLDYAREQGPALLGLPRQAFLLALPHLLQLFAVLETRGPALALLVQVRPSTAQPNRYGHSPLHKSQPLHSTDWNHQQQLLPLLKDIFQEAADQKLQLRFLNTEVLLSVKDVVTPATFLDHVLPCVTDAVFTTEEAIIHAAADCLVGLVQHGGFSSLVLVHHVLQPLLKGFSRHPFPERTRPVMVGSLVRLTAALGVPTVATHVLCQLTDLMHEELQEVFAALKGLRPAESPTAAAGLPATLRRCEGNFLAILHLLECVVAGSATPPHAFTSEPAQTLIRTLFEPMLPHRPIVSVLVPARYLSVPAFTQLVRFVLRAGTQAPRDLRARVWAKLKVPLEVIFYKPPTETDATVDEACSPSHPPNPPSPIVHAVRPEARDAELLASSDLEVEEEQGTGTWRRRPNLSALFEGLVGSAGTQPVPSRGRTDSLGGPAGRRSLPSLGSAQRSGEADEADGGLECGIELQPIGQPRRTSLARHLPSTSPSSAYEMAVICPTAESPLDANGDFPSHTPPEGPTATPPRTASPRREAPSPDPHATADHSPDNVSPAHPTLATGDQPVTLLQASDEVPSELGSQGREPSGTGETGTDPVQLVVDSGFAARCPATAAAPPGGPAPGRRGSGSDADDAVSEGPLEGSPRLAEAGPAGRDGMLAASSSSSFLRGSLSEASSSPLVTPAPQSMEVSSASSSDVEPEGQPAPLTAGLPSAPAPGDPPPAAAARPAAPASPTRLRRLLSAPVTHAFQLAGYPSEEEWAQARAEVVYTELLASFGPDVAQYYGALLGKAPQPAPLAEGAPTPRRLSVADHSASPSPTPAPAEEGAEAEAVGEASDAARGPTVKEEETAQGGSWLGTVPICTTPSSGLVVPEWEVRGSASLRADPWVFTGQCQHEFAGHTGGIRTLDVAQEDELVFVTGGKDCTVRIWRLEGTGPTYTRCHHQREVTRVRFLCKEKVATLGLDHVIGILDTERGQPIHHLQCAPAPVALEVASCDPTLLLVGTAEGTIRVFDVRCGGKSSWDWRLWVPQYGRPSITALACTADGGALAVGLSNGRCVVLDQLTGIPEHSFKAHDYPVRAMGAVGPTALVTVPQQRGGPCHVWRIGRGPPQLAAVCAGAGDAVVDVHTHQDTVFGITNTAVCMASVSAPLDQGVKFEVIRPNNVAPGAKQKPHFTGIKVLPLHRLLLLSCDDGRVRVCN